MHNVFSFSLTKQNVVHFLENEIKNKNLEKKVKDFLGLIYYSRPTTGKCCGIRPLTDNVIVVCQDNDSLQLQQDKLKDTSHTIKWMRFMKTINFVQ